MSMQQPNTLPRALTTLAAGALFGFGLSLSGMVRPEVVFSREQLMTSAYEGTFVSDRTIDSHIRNLRAKFAEAGCANVIETIHGVGFRLGSCD